MREQTETDEHEVTIVGAGPTGLMLAGELALAGIEVTVLERRPTTDLVGTRARGFHSRTLEILDQRGLAERFLAEGTPVQALSFGSTPLDLTGFPTRHPYTLGLPQAPIERILLGWVEELGVRVRRGVEVTGFAQDDESVTVHLADGGSWRTAYLVGADGGRSVVRRAAGIVRQGPPPTRSHLLAEVETTREPPWGLRTDELGIHALSPAPGGVSVLVTEPRLGPATDPTLSDLAVALTAVYGTDFGVHGPRWISRFTDTTGQATAYRAGRVLIAGDAAHVHPPTGGQGIGLGVEDAVNLGWKLAQVVRGASPETLLDSYQAERHPATRRVLASVLTQAMLQRGDARTLALGETLAELAAGEQARRGLAGLLSGLDVRLDAGPEAGPEAGPGRSDDIHPLLGRRIPDLDLETAPESDGDGPGATRVHALLRTGRWLLLDLGEPGTLDVTGWEDRVEHVPARLAPAGPGCPDPWELPVVGPVPAPAAVLARPDGHVAWVGDGTDAGLHETLAAWCGTSAQVSR